MSIVDIEWLNEVEHVADELNASLVEAVEAQEDKWEFVDWVDCYSLGLKTGMQSPECRSGRAWFLGLSDRLKMEEGEFDSLEIHKHPAHKIAAALL